MNKDIEAITARWQRRNGDVRFRFALFTEYRIGDLLPNTIVYDHLRLAIANQRFVHALRGQMREGSRALAHALRRPQP